VSASSEVLCKLLKRLLIIFSFLRNHLDTLILSFYLSVLIFLPAFTLLGTDEEEWIKAFSLSSSIQAAADGRGNPRFKLLATQVFCTFLGALIGSAGHLLDWEKAWQVSSIYSMDIQDPCLISKTLVRSIPCPPSWAHVSVLL